MQGESIIEKGHLSTLFQGNAALVGQDLIPDVYLTDKKTSALNLKRHNLTLNDMADEVGLMKTNSTAASQNQITQKDEKKKQNLAMTDFLIRLEAARQMAQDMHNYIDMRLEQINIDLNEAFELRDTLQNEADIVSDALDKFEKTGQFDLKDDGTFKNEILEKAIQEYEAEHGEINRDNIALLDQILTKKLDEYKDDIAAKDKDIEKLERDKKYFEEADRKLETAENKINSNDPNMQQQGMDGIDQIEIDLKESLSNSQNIVEPQELEQTILRTSSEISTIDAPKF